MPLQHLAPDQLVTQVFLFSPQRVSPVVRTQTTTDRQTGFLAGSDRRVLGVRYEASPRARCHRNPHPRGTVARGTVARSGLSNPGLVSALATLMNWFAEHLLMKTMLMLHVPSELQMARGTWLLHVF